MVSYLLLAAASCALLWILLPFYGVILWAGIIAMLFGPLYRRLLPRLGQRRNASAGIVVLIVLVGVVLPFGLITASLAREAAGVYQAVNSGAWNPAEYFRSQFVALPDGVAGFLEHVGIPDFDVLLRRVSTTFAAASQFIGVQALSIGLNTFDFVGSLCITLYLAFFLIRDGEALADTAWQAVPLAAEHKRELSDKFSTVVHATVKGSLLVAVIQGALGGLAFWFLGIKAALLWAVLMAFLSLLPMLGAAIVWLPVAAYLLITGELGKALLLVAWGVLVIGLIDNLLRPILVGKDTRMPDYVVMVSTLGGMAAFGINGFVVGPAIAAMFMAVWHIVVTTQARDES